MSHSRHEFVAARDLMLELQLRARGITDERVLAAMGRVPRERFVPAGDEAYAYTDAALPIACGQTISQPYIVAMMSEALALTGKEKVLEIGTGSGYQTAILAELAGEVYSIERHAELSRIASARLSALALTGKEKVLEIGTGSGYQTAILAELAGEVYSVERHAELSRIASARLSALGYQNVHLRVGDGSLGWAEAAPFDRVIITAAAPSCPPPLWQQLAEQGLLIGPFGSREEQTMTIARKVRGEAVATRSIPCRFVPLVSD